MWIIENYREKNAFFMYSTIVKKVFSKAHKKMIALEGRQNVGEQLVQARAGEGDQREQGDANVELKVKRGEEQCWGEEEEG